MQYRDTERDTWLEPWPAGGNALLSNTANASPNSNANPNVIVYPAQPSKGPAMFQEMCFHSQQLDNKDCIIM